MGFVATLRKFVMTLRQFMPLLPAFMMMLRKFILLVPAYLAGFWAGACVAFPKWGWGGVGPLDFTDSTGYHVIPPSATAMDIAVSVFFTVLMTGLPLAFSLLLGVIFLRRTGIVRVAIWGAIVGFHFGALEILTIASSPREDTLPSWLAHAVDSYAPYVHGLLANLIFVLSLVSIVAVPFGTAWVLSALPRRSARGGTATNV
jgi:hypothetical protein